MKKLLLTIILVGCGEQKTLQVSLPNVEVSGGEIKTDDSVGKIARVSKTPEQTTQISESAIKTPETMASAPIVKPMDLVISTLDCKDIWERPDAGKYVGRVSVFTHESGLKTVQVMFRDTPITEVENMEIKGEKGLEEAIRFPVTKFQDSLWGDYVVSYDKVKNTASIVIVQGSSTITRNMPTDLPCEAI